MRREFPTWSALLSDPMAHDTHLADCRGVWGGAPLDWSGVFAEIAPRVADKSREYAGLIDYEPGSWRLKITLIEAGPAGVQEIPRELRDKIVARPALFVFHTHSAEDGDPYARPSGMDLAISVAGALTTCYAADVVLSECGAVLYGLSPNYRRKRFGRSLTALPTAWEAFYVMHLACDVLMTVSATFSRDPLQLSEFGDLVRQLGLMFEYTGSKPSGKTCPTAHTNQGHPENLGEIIAFFDKEIDRVEAIALAEDAAREKKNT